MISNVMVRLSVFADYSMLVYDRKDVVKIMECFDEYNLAPSQVMEVDLNGISVPRMMFVGLDNYFSIVIFGNRIDITRVSERKQGFDSDEIADIKTLFVKTYDRLYDIFGKRIPIPYRLAWFTNYVYFEINAEQRRAFRDRFLNRIDFFEENRLDDMLAKYGTRRKEKINDQDEQINVLTTLKRWEANSGIEQIADGYCMELDINTWQNNRVNRFQSKDVDVFMDIAENYQKNVKEEVFNGLYS